MIIWTEGYFPFTMGGNVHRPVAAHIPDEELGEKFDLGGGYFGYLLTSPRTEKTYVVESTTGAFIGPTIEVVRADIKDAHAEVMADQLGAGLLRKKKATTVPFDQFWGLLKGPPTKEDEPGAEPNKGTFELAKTIATMAHEGQKRWNGDPYITHPLRVAGVMSGWRDKCVAVLHDVIEDTDVSVEELREEFGDEITEAVVALSRRDADDGEPTESYREFVRRTALNPIAKVVKIADVEDNMRDLAEGHSLRNRYIWALKTLGEDPPSDKSERARLKAEVKRLMGGGTVHVADICCMLHLDPDDLWPIVDELTAEEDA